MAERSNETILRILQAGACPACGSISLWDGPRAGLNVNQQCLMCGQWWNVARHDGVVIWAESIPHKPGFNLYFDPDYPPRRCDHCERMYRGKAVYCSRDCAEADA